MRGLTDEERRLLELVFSRGNRCWTPGEMRYVLLGREAVIANRLERRGLIQAFACAPCRAVHAHFTNEAKRVFELDSLARGCP